MASTDIDLEIRDGIAWMTLRGESTRGALDADSVRLMVEACAVIDSDDSVGAAVVQGSGGSFCSGAHTSLLAGMEGLAQDEIELRLTDVYAAFARVHDLRVPTLALVDGPAVGAGLNLAMVCDMRLASPRAVFQSGFARLGIHPGGGHFNLLARAAGYQAAAAMGLYAQRLDADAAVSAGLVWAIVESEALTDAALAAVGHLAADPVLAWEMAASLRATWRGDWDGAVAVERRRQAWTFARKLGH